MLMERPYPKGLQHYMFRDCIKGIFSTVSTHTPFAVNHYEAWISEYPSELIYIEHSSFNPECFSRAGYYSSIEHSIADDS